MSDFTFAQPERRNFLVPGLIVAALVAAAFVYIYFFTPHKIADLTVTHVAVLPTHTVMPNGSRIVGAQDASQDDFYALVTVRIDDHLKLPLFINDITGTLTTQDGADVTTTAAEKNDLDAVYTAFPALKPLASTPLLRESEVPPGGHAEGMVLLDFPVSDAVWKQRKSASVVIAFYHQDPMTITIPNP